MAEGNAETVAGRLDVEDRLREGMRVGAVATKTTCGVGAIAAVSVAAAVAVTRDCTDGSAADAAAARPIPARARVILLRLCICRPPDSKDVRIIDPF